MIRERIGYVGLGLAVLGGLALFYSLTMLAVFPEAEMGAFPFPLGVPGLLILATGLALYLVSIPDVKAEDLEHVQRKD